VPLKVLKLLLLTVDIDITTVTVPISPQKIQHLTAFTAQLMRQGLMAMMTS